MRTKRRSTLSPVQKAKVVALAQRFAVSPDLICVALKEASGLFGSHHLVSACGGAGACGGPAGYFRQGGAL